MGRWLLQLGAGLVVGVSAQAVLPGRHSTGYLTTGLLSLVGAAGASVLGKLALPRDVVRRSGFAISVLGALAMLLIHVLVAG